MTMKAKGTSVTQKLVDLAAKTGVAFPILVTSFLIERLVVRLVSEKRLQNSLVFKGGFVGLRVYDSPRYTVDLDALLARSNLDSALDFARRAAEIDLHDGVWFRFESQIDLQTQGEYGGIRQVYRAGIGEILKNIKKAQVINFDLGIGDPVTPGPSIVRIKTLLSDENLSWSVYPVETIIAEKLHAIVALANANSRSKDIHDLVAFFPKADKKILRDALERCFAFRQTALPTSFASVLKNLNAAVLERGWNSAVVSVPNAPSFKVTFDQLISQLEALDG